MLNLRDVVSLTLASSFITAHVAALPHPLSNHHARAVDVTAFAPWEKHPRPHTPVQSTLESLNATPSPAIPEKQQQINADTKAEGSDKKRAVNPEGWVPYMHYPSEDNTQGSHEKRDLPISERDDYQTVVDEQSQTSQQEGNHKTYSNGPVKRRDIDPLQTIEENRNEKAVNVVPIVGRDIDPLQTIEENRNEKAVNVVPIVGRDIDPLQTIEENRNEKAVNVVPIVGRVVDTEARDAEPISDKLSCNGERYLPSQQKCTADGLVSIDSNPSSSTTSDGPASSQKRAAVLAQCGEGVGSVSYDRSTAYCNPITQQVSAVAAPKAAQGSQGEKRDSAFEYAAQAEIPVMEFQHMYDHQEYHSDVDDDSDSDDEGW